MDAIRNTYTGEIVRVHVTQINGAYIVKRDGATVEMHRGGAQTAHEYVARMVERDPDFWQYV